MSEFNRVWGNRIPIPIVCTKKLKDLGLNWVEVPMVSIIECLHKYGTISSGFHESRGYWSIIFKNEIDNWIKECAIECGLQIQGKMIYLADVGITEIEKAEKTFNVFAQNIKK